MGTSPDNRPCLHTFCASKDCGYSYVAREFNMGSNRVGVIGFRTYGYVNDCFFPLSCLSIVWAVGSGVLWCFLFGFAIVLMASESLCST